MSTNAPQLAVIFGSGGHRLPGMDAGYLAVRPPSM